MHNGSYKIHCASVYIPIFEITVLKVCDSMTCKLMKKEVPYLNEV